MIQCYNREKDKAMALQTLPMFGVPFFCGRDVMHSIFGKGW